MDKKLGVYICGGCSIGESLNVDALVQVAQKEHKVPVCRTHPFLCGSEGVALIQQDLASDAVNAVAIAACSPRVKTDAFAFDPRMVLERINLREHVIWSHKAQDEETQALAEDYLRMGLVRALTYLTDRRFCVILQAWKRSLQAPEACWKRSATLRTRTLP